MICRSPAIIMSPRKLCAVAPCRPRLMQGGVFLVRHNKWLDGWPSIEQESLHVHRFVTYPPILARHRDAPCAESRERFLEHCAEQGYCLSSLRKIAWMLLVLSHHSAFGSPNEVTRQQIESAVDQRVNLIGRPNGLGHATSSRQMFIHIATAWCHFRKKETKA